MTSTVYQATIEELEALLSPRVVSRSLQEGLKLVGKSPETVGFQDLEKILKSQVYRQLQVAMPVSEAKTRINDIVEKIRSLEAEEVRRTSSKETLSQQTVILTNLKERLKPFNIYFEWPEVQKLRAQVQLLDNEHQAGRNAEKLIQDAKEQLNMVEQKLEGELVQQAKELVDLEDSLARVKTLGGPKVRRLEGLVGQIQTAQHNRQLALHELERARKLALDLRKTMESSVMPENMPSPIVVTAITSAKTETTPPTDITLSDDDLLDIDNNVEDLLSIDTTQLAPDVSAKLLQLDLDDEKRALEGLEKDFAQLLIYRPDLTELISDLRAKLENNSTVNAEITALRESFSETLGQERDSLQQVFRGLEQDLTLLSADVDITELKQVLQVAMGVLHVGLPAKHDVQHVHSLYQLAKEQQREAHERRQEEEATKAQKFIQQGQALETFKAALESYKQNQQLPEYQLFEKSVTMLQEAHEAQVILADQISETHTAQSRLETALAQTLGSQLQRERIQIKSLLSELQHLPLLPEVQAKADQLSQTLHQHLTQLNTSTLGDEILGMAKSSLGILKDSLVTAYRDCIMQLVQKAVHVSAKDAIADLQRAAQGLDAGRFPDMTALERSLSKATESQRTEQLNDLHDLESEILKYQSMGGQSHLELQQFIEKSRKQLERGDVIENLDDAWSMIENLRSDIDRRAISFVPRLDAALEKLDKISKLNSEEVSSAKRILIHLNSQRQSFQKVSANVQFDLEKSLSEAEGILKQLEEQFEATRAIAGQLMHSSALDDIFGIFDGEAKPDLDLNSEPDSKITTIHSQHQTLNDWFSGYTSERGIRGLAIFTDQGEMTLGQLDIPEDRLQLALAEVGESIITIGNELSLGKQFLMTLEMFRHTMIFAWPTHTHHLVIILNDPSVLSLVLHKLRRDLPMLGSWLSN
jgi:hypothetical protein